MNVYLFAILVNTANHLLYSDAEYAIDSAALGVILQSHASDSLINNH